MTKTNEFMLLFRFQPDFNNQPTAVELAAMGQQWGAYFGSLAIREKLVSTHQLGFEGMQIAADKSVSKGISIYDNQTLGGNMIIKAIDINEAAEIAKECPILLMGGNVEIRSINPM